MKQSKQIVWRRCNVGKAGFTFVEMICVMTIILILAAIMIPLASGWIGKTRKLKDKIGLENMYQSVQSYIIMTNYHGHGDAMDLLEEIGNSPAVSPWNPLNKYLVGEVDKNVTVENVVLDFDGITVKELYVSLHGETVLVTAEAISSGTTISE